MQDKPAQSLRAGYVARNFTRAELSCRHCGEYYHWPEFIGRLQRLRDMAGPLWITSAHRCAFHNAFVGGAPHSQHLTLAVDIALHGLDRVELSKAAKVAGFQGFGFYVNFLHLDLGAPRKWYGSGQARRIWLNEKAANHE